MSIRKPVITLALYALALAALVFLFMATASATAPKADLRVDMASTPLIPSEGQEATVRVRVRNLGPGTATSVTVTVNPSQLSLSVTQAPAGWLCSGMTCSTPALDAGKSVIITLTGTRSGADAYQYPSASVASITDDPNPKNNFAYAKATLP